MLDIVTINQNEMYVVDGRGNIVTIGIIDGSVTVKTYPDLNTVATLDAKGETFSFSNERYAVQGVSAGVNTFVICRFPLI